MKKTKFFDLILFVLVSFSFTGFTPVHAQVDDQTKNGFSISPPSFNINANAGDQLNNTMKIENISSQRLDLTAKSQSFVAYGSEGQIQLTGEDSAYSINSWITFDNADFSIDPGQIKLFNYTIHVPSDSQPGSHFGSIVFTTSPSEAQANTAKVIQEIGSVILIKLPGNVVENSSVTSFKSDLSYFTDPKVKLDLLVDNSGSVVVQPSGTITIQDIFGNNIQTIDVPAKNILPGSQRVFDQEFDFDKVGYFKAKLQLTYGNSKTLTAETTFITLYTQRLLPIVLIILVLLVLYIILRKRINRAISVIIKG